MRDQLIRYVDLLFAGAPNAYDIKQEILQNTLDRYDDLVSQGKSPEAAYSLAISGIGDVSELLGSTCAPAAAPAAPIRSEAPVYAEKPMWKKIIRAFAIFLYVISVIPLFVLAELGMDTIGLCGMLAIVAVATALMVVSGGKGRQKAAEETVSDSRQELRKAVKCIIGVIGLLAYLIVSFMTQGWYITWLIFPIMAAVQGLVGAIMDLKEACKHEA